MIRPNAVLGCLLAAGLCTPAWAGDTSGKRIALFEQLCRQFLAPDHAA